MDAAGLASAHAGEHLVAELGGLAAHLDDALADEGLDAFAEAAGASACLRSPEARYGSNRSSNLVRRY